MSDDLLSWKPPVARDTDPETSHVAAKIATMSASAGRMAALRHLAERPMTDFELAEASGMQQTSIGKRRGDCVPHGLVEPMLDSAGKKVTRPSPTGSPAIVWQITQAGRAFYAAHAG